MYQSRTQRYRAALSDPKRAEIIARCKNLDLGGNNLAEVVTIAIVDLGADATLDDLEHEVRLTIAENAI